MKRTIIIYPILAASVMAFSQDASGLADAVNTAAGVAASTIIVSDPKNTAATEVSNSIQTVTQTINSIMAEAQVALLDNNFFKDLGTTMEILSYIDQIACQTAELNYNLKYSKNYSCLTMLNMKDITMHLNFASSLMSKLFLAKDVSVMTKEGRIQSLNNTLDMLKKVSTQLADQNMAISGYLSAKIAKDYLKQQNYQPSSYSVASRYQKTDIK